MQMALIQIAKLFDRTLLVMFCVTLGLKLYKTNMDMLCRLLYKLCASVKTNHFKHSHRSFSGRFHHPDVLQLVSSLNEERGCCVTKIDETKDSGSSQTTGAASTTTHTSS